jgi:hypothetical protein
MDRTVPISEAEEEAAVTPRIFRVVLDELARSV